MTVAALYWWWRYFAGRIEVSDAGVTQHTPFGNRTVRWENITDYPTKSDLKTNVVSRISDGKTTLRFYGMISDGDKFQEQLRQRISPTGRTAAQQVAVRVRR